MFIELIFAFMYRFRAAGPGLENFPLKGPVIVIANHSSWLDIAVITAVAPVVFVAKREVATWPLFGLLARLQRTVFVDRFVGVIVEE